MEDEANPEVNPKSPASMVDVVPAASYNESPPPPPGVDFFESGDGLKQIKFGIEIFELSSIFQNLLHDFWLCGIFHFIAELEFKRF